MAHSKKSAAQLLRNPRNTTINEDKFLAFDVDETDGEGESRALLGIIRHRQNAGDVALKILSDLFVDADPYFYGRVIGLMKNALKAGL
tara:strand:- start:1258 stop:1521 length:264 start_codon:yes stop_codon:yes gene_type:complete